MTAQMDSNNYYRCTYLGIKMKFIYTPLNVKKNTLFQYLQDVGMFSKNEDTRHE